MTHSKHPLGHRVGGWLPRDQGVLNSRLQDIIDIVEKNPKPLHPVIREFKDLIEGDTTIFMLFHQMFEQIPYKPPYHQNPSGHSQVRNHVQMLELLNHVISNPPEFNADGHVHLPVSSIFDWATGTQAGFSAFTHEKVNAQLRKILDVWGNFLRSPESRTTLTDAENGWLSELALQEMGQFTESFICDPSQPHYGFNSWDDFFTREFRRGIRPVVFPDNDKIINNACEAAPYKIATEVKARDRFWIKDQMYSLNDMLGDQEVAAQFVGGSVYQAFLNALAYHRWHSPINGTVRKAYNLAGTYYSETPVYGFNSKDGPQPDGLVDSQGYLTAMATRAVISIESDNPNIGMMCFLGVGMQEVSSCEITVKVGQRVKKGDQIGMFHFGGSTYCMVFKAGIDIEWDLRGQVPSLDAENLHLNSAIGFVGGKKAATS